jgi:hypothetical protein
MCCWGKHVEIEILPLHTPTPAETADGACVTVLFMHAPAKVSAHLTTHVSVHHTARAFGETVRHTIADALGWPALAGWTLRDGHQLMRCARAHSSTHNPAMLCLACLHADAAPCSLYSELAQGSGPNLAAAAAAAVDPSVMVTCAADEAAGAKNAAPAAAPGPVTVNIPPLPPLSPAAPASSLASRHRGGGGSGGELTAGAASPRGLTRVSSAEARLKRSPSPKEA